MVHLLFKAQDPLIFGWFSLEANFPESKRKDIFIKVTRGLLLGAVGLLSTAGGLTGHPDMAQTQSVLSKVAYFEFVAVFLALLGMAVWLNFWMGDKIKDGQIIVSFPATLLLPVFRPALSLFTFSSHIHVFLGKLII